MSLHTDAVAQNRPARIGAGGIDSDDANLLSRSPVVGGEAIDQRAFPCPRGTCNANKMGSARRGKDLLQQFFGPWIMVFDRRDGAGDSADISRTDLTGPRSDG